MLTLLDRLLRIESRRRHVETAALQKTCTNLRRAMRITAGARFNAAKRLSDHDKRLNISVAIISCYIIIISIYQLAFHLPETSDKILSLVSVVLSIAVLVMALLQFASSDAVHAEQHHRCALEIEEARRGIDVLMVKPDRRQLLSIIDKYNNVLQNSNLNHEEDDMLLYVCTRPELGFNLNIVKICTIKSKSWLRAKIPYLITAMGGVIILSILLYMSLSKVAI